MRVLVTTAWLLGVFAVGCDRDVAADEACIAKMKIIDAAIATWALENHKATNEVVAWSDLVGSDKYLRDRPACPHGGIYSITTVAAGPTCSIDEDTAYFRRHTSPTPGP